MTSINNTAAEPELKNGKNFAGYTHQGRASTFPVAPYPPLPVVVYTVHHLGSAADSVRLLPFGTSLQRQSDGQSDSWCLKVVMLQRLAILHKRWCHVCAMQ